MGKKSKNIHPEYKVSLLPEDKRPREKLIKQGPDVLKNSELLAVILNTGYKEETVIDLASRILSEYGSKAITRERSVERLMGELGLPTVKACQVVACFELGRRFFSEQTGRMRAIRDAEDVYAHVHDITRLKKEVLRGLYLNARNRLIHDEVISIGTLNASIVHPREVLGPAIEFSAGAFIVAHNHPSGELNPSDEDLAITRRLAAAGKIVGIDLLDHVIVTKDGYTSLKQQGII